MELEERNTKERNDGKDEVWNFEFYLKIKLYHSFITSLAFFNKATMHVFI